MTDGSAMVAETEETHYRPNSLRYGTRYYWRIDEINDVGTRPRHEGPVWTFDAPEYDVIDDFERYRDEELLEIWATWMDGFDDPANGAIVGHDNEAETTIVYEGRQSMPIHYDLGQASVATATREFNPPLDWRIGEPTILALQFRGHPSAFLEDAAGNMTVGASGVDIWGAADEFRFVYKPLTGDGSITARADGILQTDPFAFGGVMIRDTLTPASSFAAVGLTGSNGVRFRARQRALVSATSDTPVLDGTQQTLAAPVWIRIERQGNEFNGYYATDEAGTNWVAMSWNPQTLSMDGDTLIGLAVTSHNARTSTVSRFSHVTTTGNVSGSWTAEAIGGPHPANDPTGAYLIVKDTSGREAMIPHANPLAATLAEWQPWHIPLSDLGQVDPSSIRSITVGVGDPGAAPTGAKGTVFVDQLQVGTPRPSGEGP